jgi:hypothetical protein
MTTDIDYCREGQLLCHVRYQLDSRKIGYWITLPLGKPPQASQVKDGG